MLTHSSPACDILLFGALGDLAQRKLMPALFQLERFGLLNAETRLMALGREALTAEGFCLQSLQGLARQIQEEELGPAVLERFFKRFAYTWMDFQEPDEYGKVAAWRQGHASPLLVYMATPASLYGIIGNHLSDFGVLSDTTRVVIEKPIGHDFLTSCQINDQLARYFSESQLYRIDHYLGKETVQNLIALRFANNLFATQWNQKYISHVEITVAETVGIEGRWGYFDQAGQLRDMVQNHLLQLLCLIAMDPPSDLSADSIRDEKVKVLKALQPLTRDNMLEDLVRGQYTAGTIKGESVPGYLEEDGAVTGSATETFVALKARLANWRWAGVPFYLRTGKRMAQKYSQIIIHFKPAPHYIFDPDQKSIANNKLIIRLQPDEGISLQVLTKDHGLDKGMRLRQDPLQLSFSKAFRSERIPDAYERLLWEVMKGNQYLFVRRDEVEYAWRWIDQLIASWDSLNLTPRRYPAGSWGPVASNALITRDGKSWYEDA